MDKSESEKADELANGQDKGRGQQLGCHPMRARERQDQRGERCILSLLLLRWVRPSVTPPFTHGQVHTCAIQARAEHVSNESQKRRSWRWEWPPNEILPQPVILESLLCIVVARQPMASPAPLLLAAAAAAALVSVASSFRPQMLAMDRTLL